MNKIKNYLGLVIGDFTVIGEGVQKKSHTYYPCRCTCGSIELKIIIHLKKNKYPKCSNCRKGENSHAWKGVGLLPRDVFNTIFHGAVSRNLKFDITMEQIWDIYLKQDGKCALTGWPIQFNATYRTKTSKTASLDRIDSTRGYTVDNVQWLHTDVNRLKRNYPNDKFIDMCLAIAKHNFVF